MKIAALLVVAISVWAQTFSSHSGWTFTDSVQSATDVLVADIASASATDSGSEVNVQATLRAIRILKGDMSAGAEVAVQWHYRPGPREGPAVTTKVPHARGLWFLRRNAEGALEALQAGVMTMTSLGGAFLPLGASAPSYADDEPLQTKIAREIGAALEDFVATHAAELIPLRPAPDGSAHGLPWRPPFLEYQALAMALQSLDPKAAAPVYESMSVLPDPNLKTLGILGRLETGDSSAVFDLERSLPAVLSGTAALHTRLLPSGLGRLDLRNDLPAAHALARIALSDPSFPRLEAELAFTLARTHSPEMLPYLVVMLGSPEPWSRDSALMAFCQLLGSPTPAAFWSPEMAGYCPNASPVNDRELEQKDIQFWIGWWDSHREEIAKTVRLPSPAVPARYGAAPREVAPVPVEVRFEFLLHMAAEKPPDHYHAADGTIVEGPPPGSDALFSDPVSDKLEPADRAILHQVLEAVNAKLAAIQERSGQIMNAARVAGTMPSLQQLKELSAARQTAIKAGLTDLESKLSPEGWQIADRFLKGMDAGSSSGVIISVRPEK
jgi:hypothetical protein